MNPATQQTAVVRRIAPWGSFGTLLDGVTDSEKAIEQAGMDWRVELQPAMFENPTTGNVEVIPKRFAITRQDTGDVFGMSSARYKPWQNSQAFGFMDTIIREAGLAYTAAGTLDKGARAWLIAEFPKATEMVKGDRYKQYLLLSNGHNGVNALRIRLFSLRMVCTNGLIAYGSNGMCDYNIRHSSAISSKVRQAQQVLQRAPEYLEEARAFQRALADKGFSLPRMRQLAKVAFNVGDKPDEDIATRTQTQIHTLVELYETGQGNDRPGIKGTAVAALNAATEFDTHHRKKHGKTEAKVMASRFSNMWFHPGSTIQSRVVNELATLIN